MLRARTAHEQQLKSCASENRITRIENKDDNNEKWMKIFAVLSTQLNE